MPKIFRPYESAMEFLWEKEGGFVNDPVDPGGATNFGITLRTAKENGLDIDGDGDVDIDDIRQMTPEAAMSVYKSKYWDALNASSLPWDLAIAAFDAAVNCGVYRVKNWLDAALRSSNPVSTIMDLRQAHYLEIIKRNPPLKKFKNGWFNRVNDLKKYISILNQSIADGDISIRD